MAGMAAAQMGTSILGGIMAGVGALIAAPDKVKIPDWIGIDPTEVQGANGWIAEIQYFDRTAHVLPPGS